MVVQPTAVACGRARWILSSLGALPGEGEHRRAREDRGQLNGRARTRALCERIGEGEARERAAPEAEEMRREGDLRAGPTEHRDEGEPRREGDPRSAPARAALVAAPGGEAREDADEAEDAGRRADGAVGGAVVEGVGEIADGAGRDEARDADSLAQSHRLVSAMRPDVVLLNPLVLCAGGVELELLESMQRDEDPVPVILLVDDLQALAEARHLRLPFRDFVLKPASPAECVHRVELAMQTRTSIRNLHSRARALESQVSIDFKTGLISERHMRGLIDREWKRAQRHQNPLSLLLIDVDNFKTVNDSTEYAFGDEVLRKVADALKNNVRETDYAARFGGDEFVVLLPHQTPTEASVFAERLRAGIKALSVPGLPQGLSVSVGIAGHWSEFPKDSPEVLLRASDEALYEAKRRGRDRVVLYEADVPPGEQGETLHA